MAHRHRIMLVEGDSYILVLPDGREVSIVLSDLEPGEQLPELDICLPALMMANCFGNQLAPGRPHETEAHIVEARQIVVPLTPRPRGTITVVGNPPLSVTHPCEGGAVDARGDQLDWCDP